jgi:hypothetical protein
LPRNELSRGRDRCFPMESLIPSVSKERRSV